MLIQRQTLHRIRRRDGGVVIAQDLNQFPSGAPSSSSCSLGSVSSNLAHVVSYTFVFIFLIIFCLFVPKSLSLRDANEELWVQSCSGPWLCHRHSPRRQKSKQMIMPMRLYYTNPILVHTPRWERRFPIGRSNPLAVQ